jgi:hypothetical protein
LRIVIGGLSEPIVNNAVRSMSRAGITRAPGPFFRRDGLPRQASASPRGDRPN